VSRTVLFVLPSFGGGGAERVIITIANHLNRSEWSPVVVVCDGTGELKHMLASDIGVIDLKKKHVRNAIPSLISVVWKMKPDILLTTLTHLNFAVAMIRPFLPPRTSVIAREANLPRKSLAGESHPRLYQFSYRYIYKRFDIIVAQSEQMQRDIVGSYRISPSRVRVIYNPVDLDTVNRMAAGGSIPNWPSPGMKLLAVGRLAEQKGFDLLLRSIAHMKHRISLVVLGEGDEREHLEHLSRKLGITDRVDFRGYDTNPYRWMRHADLFVLSSRYEGFPNAVLEAMVCGTPVAAFQGDTSVQEIICNEGEGSLTSSSSIESLAAAIDKALDTDWDEDVLKRSIRERFGVKEIVMQYEGLFSSLLSRK